MKQLSETASAARGRLRRIEGRHNPLVKLLRQAFAGADCARNGDCAVEGLRIVEEAIRSGLRFRAVFFRESEQDLAERLLPQIGAHVETLLLPNKIFDNAVPSETPQGVAALVHLKEFSLEEITQRLQLGPLVVIAGLQDPGNLGTILRSAEAFGGAGVVLGEGTVSPFNAKVVRASAGSIFRVPVIRRKLDAVSSQLRAQEIRLVATSSHKGTPLGEARLTGSLAMFIGNEGSGLPRDLMTRMDEVVVIPHAPQVESLNAGVATSILLYEAERQRK
jgi:RNA methyltransferase, TrmH family